MPEPSGIQKQHWIPANYRGNDKHFFASLFSPVSEARLTRHSSFG
jgi:hypothetical protein